MGIVVAATRGFMLAKAARIIWGIFAGGCSDLGLCWHCETVTATEKARGLYNIGGQVEHYVYLEAC